MYECTYSIDTHKGRICLVATIELKNYAHRSLGSNLVTSIFRTLASQNVNERRISINYIHNIRRMVFLLLWRYEFEHFFWNFNRSSLSNVNNWEKEEKKNRKIYIKNRSNFHIILPGLSSYNKRYNWWKRLFFTHTNTNTHTNK